MLASLAAVLIAWVTVICHTARVARAKPVRALRYEQEYEVIAASGRSEKNTFETLVNAVRVCLLGSKAHELGDVGGGIGGIYKVGHVSILPPLSIIVASVMAALLG